MSEKKSLKNLLEKYDSLRQELSKTGLLLQGSINKRVDIRPDPYNFGKKKEYGPYYQWTKKIKGKTVTMNLTESQSETYGQAIEENKKTLSIINEMRALSLKILENKTDGVKKRKVRN